MERVSIIEGTERVLLVAPHGPDDPHTAIMAETMAGELNSYAVINRGWERAKSVDWANDKANCNDVTHCKQDVVREEFLDPILDYANRMQRDFFDLYVILIHGVSFSTKRKVRPDIVVGYGAGEPPSYSCDIWKKDALLFHLIDAGFEAYQGKAGGDYSGRRHDNLNQLFRKWYVRQNIHSFQLEISREWRENEDDAIETGGLLSGAIQKLLEEGDDYEKPPNFNVADF